MRRLVLAAALAAVASTASAQQNDSIFFGSTLMPGRPMPVTTVIKAPDGTLISTATTSGDTTIYRDAKGELTGSSTVEADGTVSYHDPHGKLTGTAKIDGAVTTIRNAAGDITGTRTREGNVTVMRDPAGNIVGKTERGN